MQNYRVLLASLDSELIGSVREIATRNRCEFVVRPFLMMEPNQPLPHLVLLHVTEHGCSEVEIGLELLREFTDTKPPIRLGVIFDSPNPRQELVLLEAGAVEVFTRPLDLNRLSLVLNSLTLDAEIRRPASPSPPIPAKPVPAASPAGRREILSLAELQSHASRHGILFRSQKMAHVMDCLRHVVARESNILISGETGTGKTQLAQLIHNLSPRRPHPFVVANCAAITPSLLESELFGHAKGAFTGATQAHDGKFHAAHGGTLFLDEIDSLPPSGQQRLLRVLDQKVFEKVGSNESHTLNARIIAAANRPLEKLVADGQFRSDLYYRLKVVTVDMPALRERPEDIVPIALHLARQEAEREGDPVPELTADVLDRLTRYDWPGNIRELRNVISQMVVFGGGSLSLDALLASLTNAPPRELSRPAASLPADPHSDDALDAALRSTGNHSTYSRPLQFERAKSEAARILRELRQHDYNRTETARSLGISRTALYKKLKKLNLAGFL